MSGHQLKWGVAAIVLATNLTLHAQIAQDPLLSRTAAVEPNIVFIFDDSASMVSTAIYQFGGGAGYQGNRGPNNDTECLVITSSNCVWTLPPSNTFPNGSASPNGFYGRSPDVNLIYYDPRVTYKRRINADGSLMAAGPPTAGTSWNVYFYKPPTVTTYAVNTVGVAPGGSGYGAGVTASFPAPPAGGTQATATVQTGTRYTAGTVAVTDGGYGYSNTVGAQVTAAPAGGTTAIATVQTSDVYSATGFNLTSRGSGFPAGGVTASFNAPPFPPGVQATASVSTILTKQLQAVTLLTGGACSAGFGVSVSAPSSPGGVQATVSAVRTAGGNSKPLTSFSVVTRGSGYALASLPTLSFSGCSINPTYTLTLQDTYMLNAITLGNPGAGYPSAPVLTINAGGGTGYTVSVNTATSKTITGITITNPGVGYTTPPALSLTNATGGTGFAGTMTVLSTNAITGVTVGNPGGGYLVQPTLTLASTGGGTGAAFSYSYTPTVTGGINQEWDGTSNPNGLAAGKGPVSAGDYFNPYVPDSNSPLLTPTAVILPYPVLASSATANYPRFINRNDCGTSTCTWAQELQNYANWKLYHSTRIDLAKTGVGLAFQPLNPTFRLGWGTLGEISGLGSTTSSCSGSGTAGLNKGVRLFSNSTPGDFLTWLYAINGNVLCTPSRFALDNVGKYYQRPDSGGPWANAPIGNGAITGSGIVDSSHATCRRSYSMLMTDGYYNDTFTMTPGDFDSTTGPTITQPRSFQYTPAGPFSDNVSSSTKYSNTLADVAMKYWVTDLRPDLNNGIKSVSSDDAYWQHMNFYAIGLGLVGSLDATSPAVLQSLTGTTARTVSWPLPLGNDVYSIDDMWHATINGHGKMLNAKTAAQLNSSIQQMMSDIGGKEGGQAGVAVSTISLTSDTRKYTPNYTPVSWTGNVTAYNLNQTNANQASIAWQVETPSTNVGTGVTTYSSRIPAEPSRNIYVGTGNTSPRAVPFTYAAMSAGMLASMGSTGITPALINYLRGSTTDEDTDTTGSAPTAIYRGRQTRLGDVVNSTPVYVKDSVNLGYSTQYSTVPGKSSYDAFLAAKAGRLEGALFVGANDGMLHVFRDGTYGPGDVPIIPGGAEVFAYVPNALLPTLSKLSDKAYSTSHQYYVDGPNTETDAFLPIRGSWANIVLGSTGGGAGAPSSSGVSPRNAVFAIDATSLNSSVTGMTASSVLWEISSATAGPAANPTPFAELGYLLTDVQAGVTKGGEWIAVFGNGYESKSCQARLFIVNLETGALLKEINTLSGSCAAGSKNGLGGVRLVIDEKTKRVLGAYAGDLLGNMWKFNLDNNSQSSSSVDLGGAPLFKAGATQPITAAPTAISLPMVGTTDPAAGFMVVFGTGKFYEVPDITSTALQTLYGVWDPLAFGAASIPTGTALTNSSLLVQQTVGPQVNATSGNIYFGISSNAVTYIGASPKRGWYLNLPNSGQRLVYPLDLLAKRFVVADTISPANVSLDPCTNAGSGTGYLYIIDALNGGGPSQPVLDTNGDGSVDSNDLVVSGLQGMADGRNVSIIVSQNDLAITYANVGGGAPGATIIRIGCELTNTCVVPLPGVRHQWRQLFLR